MPPRPNAPPVATNAPVTADVASLFAQVKAKGPILMPAAGDHLPATWGVKVPARLYADLEKLGSRTIPRSAPDGTPVVVYLALPAKALQPGERELHADGNCVLTVIGYQYADHWEYAYSFLSGNCFFDNNPGGGGGGGGVPGTVGPAAAVPNCPVPSGAAGTAAETAINASQVLKDLATFLANNRNSPSIHFSSANPPTNDDGTGVDAQSNYSANSGDGSITLYTKGLAASKHPLEQVIYHELLHYYFVYGQYDISGLSALPILPQGGTATATINGVAYSFNLNDHSKDGGYQSYEHVLVHDALVAAFGSDKTGALAEALKGAQPPISAADQTKILADYGGKKIDGSIKAVVPGAGQVCGVTKYPTSGLRSARSTTRGARDLISDMAGITFDDTYVVPPAPAPTVPPWCTLDSYGACGNYTVIGTTMGCTEDDGSGGTRYSNLWQYQGYSVNTGQVGFFQGVATPMGGQCYQFTVNWQGDPQTAYGDPNLPGPYDMPPLY